MATLEARLVALAQAVGADIKALSTLQGLLANLQTTDKTSLVAAINEVLVAANAGGGGGASINDAVGDGATTVTWSANKIFDELAAAKAAVVDQLTSGAAAALDTLAEIAAAVGNDANFAATIATALGLRVRVDAAQAFDGTQQAQARTNIGAVAAAAIGDPDRDLAAAYVLAKA